MKIRFGFVSNSSTTSFCIYGVYIEDTEDLLKKFGVEDKYDLFDIIEKKYKDLFTSGGGEYCDGIYIGKSLTNIKDDETGLQFKESTKKIIEEITGKETSCAFIEESWRDG